MLRWIDPHCQPARLVGLNKKITRYQLESQEIIKDKIFKIKQLKSEETTRIMNAYIFDIYIMHSIMLEHKEEEGTFTTYHDLLEIGPINMPVPSNLKRIKDMIRDISSKPVTSNWWTDFSTWDDFNGLLRTGTKLPIHSIVSIINNELQLLDNNLSYMWT